MDPSRIGEQDRHPADDARLRALAFSVFFLGFAGQAFRNLLDWPGFILVALIATSTVVAALWQVRRQAARHVALPLAGFLLVAGASLLWSYYQWTTLLGLLILGSTTLAGFTLAVVLPWQRLLGIFAGAITSILALSLAFELFVSVGLGTRLAPLFLPQRTDFPGAYYWSENRLFDLGPIQGIVGNRNLLAFIAVLALVACIAKLRIGTRHPEVFGAGIALSVVTFALTRSATVVVLILLLAALTGALAVVRRVAPPHRPGFYVGAGGLALGAGGLILAHAHLALGLLGRTGTSERTDIWRTVAALAEQRPLLGWGWVSYWAPWIHPYAGLIEIDGVQYLQAHNALLDVWLQLGLLGVVAALALAVPLAVTAWRRAVRAGPGGPAVLAWSRLMLVAALFGQSFTESRLLVEGNWLLLTLLATELLPVADLLAQRAVQHQHYLQVLSGKP